MDVSVIIINWRSRALLETCLDSLYAHTTGLTVETVVADNGSFDGSEGMVRRGFPEVTFRQLGHNFGFAKANNLAARGTKGRYLLFLNPDTKLLTNAVEGMATFLDTHGTYHAAGCRLEGPDGQIQLTCARTYPSPIRQLSYLAMMNRMFPHAKALSSVEMTYWDHRDERDVDCLSGACMMVRRTVFEELGGFDENLFMYAEDVDLCYRIRRDGGLIRYLPGERIVHYGAASTPTKGNYFGALMQRESNLYFMRKHFGRLSALAFRGAVGAGSFLRMGAVLVLVPLYPFVPRRVGPALAAFGKYRVLALWSLGLRKARIPR